jgi:PAS domain S-box-containing protein
LLVLASKRLETEHRRRQCLCGVGEGARKVTSGERTALSHSKANAVRDADYQLLRARSRLGFCVVLFCIALFSISDVTLARGGLHAMHLVRLVQFAALAVVFYLLRIPFSRRTLVAIDVVFIGMVYVTSAAAGYLRNDPRTQMVTDLALAFGTATTLPWGVWAQLVSVVIAALSASVSTYLVNGDLTRIGAPTAVALAVALIASVYIAYQLERYRTERDRAEEALRRSEERFRSLIEHGSDTITIVDAMGTILYESPSIERILGYRPEELIGRSFLDYVHPEDVARIPWTVPDRGAVVSIECRCRRKDGAWCDVEAVGTNLLAHPAVRGVVINWRDISERKRAEEERELYTRELAQARDAALASTRAKSTFLANTSHEIRTPMNVIIGMTDMALEAEPDPVVQDYLQRVRSAALALLGIISDILDLSKIESGKVEIESRPFDLQMTIGEVVRLLIPLAAAKDLALTCRVDATSATEVRGDAGRLRQVLTNLVGNAIKFTERGEVALEARVMRETPSHAEILFVVRDTGIGIPLDRQAAVFESFTQVDDSTTRKYGGTGLGLAISRQFVELMGGELRVESTVGEGSAFSFTLALALELESPGTRRAS